MHSARVASSSTCHAGSVIDEAALVRALAERRIAGAGLDVFENEPHVPAELMGLDNVVLLPHIASATEETRQAMADRVFDNLERFFADGTLVSPAPLPRLVRLSAAPHACSSATGPASSAGTWAGRVPACRRSGRSRRPPGLPAGNTSGGGGPLALSLRPRPRTKSERIERYRRRFARPYSSKLIQRTRRARASRSRSYERRSTSLGTPRCCAEASRTVDNPPMTTRPRPQPRRRAQRGRS